MIPTQFQAENTNNICGYVSWNSYDPTRGSRFSLEPVPCINPTLFDVQPPKTDVAKHRVYIAGPMTGIEAFNFPTFNKVARHLLDNGYDVFNPAKSFGGDTTLKRSTYFKHDLAELVKCDEVVLLPGWEKSAGARLEVAAAQELGLNFRYFDGFKIWTYSPPKINLSLDEETPKQAFCETNSTESVEKRWKELMEGAAGILNLSIANEPSLKIFATGAVRSNDGDGVRYDLISPIAINALAETYKEGSDKYGDYNWEKGMPANECLNRAIRHIYLWLSGDRLEPHLAHALWNIGATIHSLEAWPELNEGKFRTEGCKAPV